MNQRAAGAVLVAGAAGAVIWLEMERSRRATVSPEPAPPLSTGDQVLAAYYDQQNQPSQPFNVAGVAGTILGEILMGGFFSRGGGGFFASGADAIATDQGASAQAVTIGGGVGALLDTIAAAEVGRGGYDTPSSFTQIQPPKPLSQMTVAEVQAWQNQNRQAGARSTAAGRYQIISPTLNDLVRRGVLSPGERFDAGAQDRAALALAERRGLSDFQQGRLTREQFGQNLSMEWAGLPAFIQDKRGRPAQGQSYYEGDGLNAATVSLDTILQALRGIA